MAQKAIGLFSTIDVMSCRGLDLFNKATLNLSIDKICSNVALRIWEFSLSFMFYSPKVVYIRAKILESLSQRVFILVPISRILFMMTCLSLKVH